MTFAERLNQIIINKNREEQFSGVVLIKQDEEEWFKAAYDYANLPWKVQRLHLEIRLRQLLPAG